jgi:hypothetical protein
MGKSSKIVFACCLVTTLAVAGASAVSAGPATSARGRAYGAKLLGVAELPNAEAQVAPGIADHDDTDAVASDLSPLLTAGALHVEGDASTSSNITASMQSTIDGATSASLPGSWNARGFAEAVGINVGSLGPGLPALSANVVDAEAVSACVNGNLVHGSAAKVLGLSLVTPPALPGPPGTPIPLPAISTTQPNQVLLDALGLKLTFWETNWNPSNLRTTDGSSTVYTNAVHLVTPLGDVIISHAESTATCGNDGDGGGGGGGGGGGTPQCSDGIDNDGDGSIDLDDPDCSSPDDNSEGSGGGGGGGGTPQCSDGVDNDGDGNIDLDDADCSSPDDNSEGSGGSGGGGVPRACRTAGAIVGTNGNDRLTGTSGRDIICGLAGRDVIRGKGSKDRIFGNKGHDRMFGKRGNDKIRGHAGRDNLVGGGGKDRLRGGRGKDSLRGGRGNDLLKGQGGHDRCRPGSGRNRMSSCEVTR